MPGYIVFQMQKEQGVISSPCPNLFLCVNKLFIYNLSKTSVRFRMVSNVLPFPLPTTSYSIRPQYLIFFSFQWFPKLFADDYLAKYMTGVETTNVEVYNSCYHDNALEVFLKALKDGRAIVTRGWTKVVRV